MGSSEQIPPKAVAELVELYGLRVSAESERGFRVNNSCLEKIAGQSLPFATAEKALQLFKYDAVNAHDVMRACVDFVRQLVLCGPQGVLVSQSSELEFTDAEISEILASIPGLKEYWELADGERLEKAKELVEDCSTLFAEVESKNILHPVLMTGVRSFHNVALLKRGTTFSHKMRGVQEWLQLMDEVGHLILNSPNAPAHVVEAGSAIKERTNELWWKVVLLYERLDEEFEGDSDHTINDIRETWLDTLEKSLSDSCSIHVTKKAEKARDTDNKGDSNRESVPEEDEGWGQERYVKLYKMAQMDRWLREHKKGVVSYIMQHIAEMTSEAS